MYYDLVASLPHLPHFERAERLPITRLRLDQRLRLLKPAHADQLARAQSLVRWRPDRLLGQNRCGAGRGVRRADGLAAGAAAPRVCRVPDGPADAPGGFAAEAGRSRHCRTAAVAWGVGPRVRHVQTHWDEPDFRLAHLYPWLPQAQRPLGGRRCARPGAAADGRRLALARPPCRTEHVQFRGGVLLTFFKWDMLRAWLACDADKGKTRFKDLIDQVTHVEHN